MIKQYVVLHEDLTDAESNPVATDNVYWLRSNAQRDADMLNYLMLSVSEGKAKYYVGERVAGTHDNYRRSRLSTPGDQHVSEASQ